MKRAKSQGRQWCEVGRLSKVPSLRAVLLKHMVTLYRDNNTEFYMSPLSNAPRALDFLSSADDDTPREPLVIDNSLLMALVECSSCHLARRRGVVISKNTRRFFQLDPDLIVNTMEILLELASLGIFEMMYLKEAEKAAWDYVDFQ